MVHLSTIGSFFPYDPTAESVMAHRHLVIAYGLTWFVHLCYLGYVGRKWFTAKRLEP